MVNLPLLQKFTKYKIWAGIASVLILFGWISYEIVRGFSSTPYARGISNSKSVDTVAIPSKKMVVDTDERSKESRVIGSYVEKLDALTTTIEDINNKFKGIENKLSDAEKEKEKNDVLNKMVIQLSGDLEKVKKDTQKQSNFNTPPPPPPPPLPPSQQTQTMVLQPMNGANNQQQNPSSPQAQTFSPNTSSKPKEGSNTQSSDLSQPQTTKTGDTEKGMKIYRKKNMSKDGGIQSKEGLEQKYSAYDKSVKIPEKNKMFSGTITTAVVEPLFDKQEGTVNMVDSVIPARIVQGIDAPTFENKQVNPPFVLMEVTDMSFFPNDERFNFEKCFILGEGYGDLSSDRAHIRTVNMRCIKGNKSAFINIVGYVAGSDGKEGVRGRVVSRQGVMMVNAMIAGFFSGFGKAMSTASNTISTSPLGATQTVDPSKIFQSGAYSGVGNAFDKLADYYIKLVDMMHPIIEIDANVECSVIITQPAYMIPIEA